MGTVTLRFRDKLTGRFTGTRKLPLSVPIFAAQRIAVLHGYDAEILSVSR